MKKIILLASISIFAACGLQVRGTGTTTGGNPNTGNPNESGFTVGGEASGVPVGKTVKVTIEGNEYDIDNGTFTFPLQFENNDPYNVDIVTGPGGAYTCTLENDSGNIPNANVTNVFLNCECAIGSLGVGTGTSANPILVYTADQLNGIAVAATAPSFLKDYKQVCDLDYGDMSPKPIGQQTNPFMGNYDGNGFYILNYTSNENTPSLGRRKGLFGYTFGSWLKNINLKDFNLKADANMGTVATPAYMGALVGSATESFIERIYAENVSIHNNGNYFHGIGGLIGYQSQSDLSGTSTVVGLNNVHLENVDVTGGISNKVGGVVGYSQVGTEQVEIANSHIHSCAFRCGGVAGAIFNKAVFADINAYNVTVEGNEAVGGITGENIGLLDRTAFVGTVNGLTTLGGFGGIIGKGNFSDPAFNSYTVSDILNPVGTTAAGRINGSPSLITNIAFDSTQTCQNCTVNSGTAYNGDSAFRAGSHVSQTSWDFNTTWCLTSSFPRLANVPNAICEEPEL